MNRNFVLQRDNSQNSSLKLLDFAPNPITVSLLQFASQRFLQNSNAPFFLQIGTLAQDFLLKIFRELVFWHLQRITRFPSDGQPNVLGERRGRPLPLLLNYFVGSISVSGYQFKRERVQRTRARKIIACAWPLCFREKSLPPNREAFQFWKKVRRK